MDDYLRVRLGSKLMALASQFFAQLHVIIDLTIENQPHCFFGIRHWLMASGQINDGKPPKPEPKRTGNKVTLVIGSAVCDGTRHPHNGLALHRFASLEIKLACYAAHFLLHLMTEDRGLRTEG